MVDLGGMLRREVQVLRETLTRKKRGRSFSRPLDVGQNLEIRFSLIFCPIAVRPWTSTSKSKDNPNNPKKT